MTAHAPAAAATASSPSRRSDMMQRRQVMRVGLGLTLSLAGQRVAQALALEPPTEAVVLTLSGRVRNANFGNLVQFDMPMLERLPQTTFSTRSPWFAQAREFTGPLMRDVLRSAGAQGTELRVRALNDYRVDIPFEDAQRYDLIVARLLDGAPMPIRNKGPLFAIYPFDALPELRNAVFYSRSAWQLRSIEVR